MRLLLLAAPGAGKGTQGEALAARYDVRHVASGDLLRAEIESGSELGRKAKQYTDAGDLVPDELLRDLLLPAIEEASAEGGYILDGFPRTVAQSQEAQAIAESRGFPLDAVVYLEVPEEELVRRLLARGRGADDSEATIRHRLEVYEQQTAPLVARYRERELLHEVDGSLPPGEVTAAIVKLIEAELEDLH